MQFKYGGTNQDIPVADLIEDAQYRAATRAMTGVEYDRLSDSWDKLGQTDAIVVFKRGHHQFAIVDGYHRVRKAKESGAKLIKADILLSGFEDATLEARMEFIKSRNEARRHLTFSEKVEQFKAAKAELGIRRGGNRTKVENIPTCADAAEKAGFKSVASARKDEELFEAAPPELVEAIDKGSITKHAARKKLGIVKPKPVPPPVPEPHEMCRCQTCGNVHAKR